MLGGFEKPCGRYNSCLGSEVAGPRERGEGATLAGTALGSISGGPGLQSTLGVKEGGACPDTLTLPLCVERRRQQSQEIAAAC